MKKNIITLLVSLSIILPATYVSAETLKVGYVNIQRIFRDAPAAIRASKKIDAEFSKRDQELQRIDKELQSKQESFEKNALTMSESDRRTRGKELNDLSRDLQRKQREFREDLNLRQNEENAAIIEKVNKAIRQVAEAEKYDLVIQDAVWVSPRIDITDKIIKTLPEGK